MRCGCRRHGSRALTGTGVLVLDWRFVRYVRDQASLAAQRRITIPFLRELLRDSIVQRALCAKRFALWPRSSSTEINCRVPAYLSTTD